MFVQFSTEELTETDVAMLRVLVGQSSSATAATVHEAPKKQPATPKAKEPEPEPEPEPEDDVLGGEEDEPEVTTADVVKKATELVGQGRSAEVKKFLKDSLGVERVGKIPDAAGRAAFMKHFA